MKNEPLDFVRNSMVWYGTHFGNISLLTDRQRDGTAVPSLASEHLHEAELLSGPERQWTEEVIKNTLGSMFQGEFMNTLRGSRHIALTSSTSRF